MKKNFLLAFASLALFCIVPALGQTSTSQSARSQASQTQAVTGSQSGTLLAEGPGGPPTIPPRMRSAELAV